MYASWELVREERSGLLRNCINSESVIGVTDQIHKQSCKNEISYSTLLQQKLFMQKHMVGETVFALPVLSREDCMTVSNLMRSEL